MTAQVTRMPESRRGVGTVPGRVLRLAEWLIKRACRQLPDDVRDERYLEWAAELPAVLHDPEVRFAPRRAVRTLLFAADQGRGTRPLRQARIARHRRTDSVLVASPVAVAVAIFLVGVGLIGVGVGLGGHIGGHIVGLGGQIGAGLALLGAFGVGVSGGLAFVIRSARGNGA